MQTFLPYKNFAKSAEVLNRQHLFNQINECLSITRALVEGRGWIHHPATKMWTNHERHLYGYAGFMCDELEMRGASDNWATVKKIGALTRDFGGINPPWWLRNETSNPLFHITHQSNLIRKGYDPKLFPGVPADLEYLWPMFDRPGTWFLSKEGCKRVFSGERQHPGHWWGVLTDAERASFTV